MREASARQAGGGFCIEFVLVGDIIIFGFAAFEEVGSLEVWLGSFVLSLAVVIPTPMSLCGGPFASQLCVSHRNYY